MDSAIKFSLKTKHDLKTANETSRNTMTEIDEEGIIKEDVSLTPPSLTPPLVSPTSDSSSPLPLAKSSTSSKQVDANSVFTFYPNKKAIAHRNRYFPSYQKYKHYYPIVNAEKKLLELEVKLAKNDVSEEKSTNEINKKKITDKNTTKFKKREDVQFEFMEEIEMKPFDLFAFNNTKGQSTFIRKSFISFTKTQPNIAYSENSKFCKKKNVYQKLDEVFKSIPFERVSIIKEFLDGIKKNDETETEPIHKVLKKRNWYSYWYNQSGPIEYKMQLEQQMSGNVDVTPEQCSETCWNGVAEIELTETVDKSSPVMIRDKYRHTSPEISEQTSQEAAQQFDISSNEKSPVDSKTMAEREEMINRVISVLSANSDNEISSKDDDEFLKQILGEENHKFMLEWKKKYDPSVSACGSDTDSGSASGSSSSNSSTTSESCESNEKSQEVTANSNDLDGWDIESCSDNNINLKLDTSDLLQLNNDSIVLPDSVTYTPSRLSSPSSKSTSPVPTVIPKPIETPKETPIQTQIQTPTPTPIPEAAPAAISATTSTSSHCSNKTSKFKPSTPTSTPPPTPEKPKDTTNDKDKHIDVPRSRTDKNDKSSDSKSRSSSSKSVSKSKNPYKSKPKSLTPPVSSRKRKRSRSRSRSRPHSRSRSRSRSVFNSRNRHRSYSRSRRQSRKRSLSPIYSRSRSRSNCRISPRRRSSTFRYSRSNNSTGRNTSHSSSSNCINTNKRQKSTHESNAVTSNTTVATDKTANHNHHFSNSNENSHVNETALNPQQNDANYYPSNEDYMVYNNCYYDVNFDCYKQNVPPNVATNNVNVSFFGNMIGGPTHPVPSSILLPDSVSVIPIPPLKPVELPEQIQLPPSFVDEQAKGHDTSSPKRLSLDDRIQNELNKSLSDNNVPEVRQISGFGVTTQVVQVGNVLQILPVNASTEQNGSMHHVAIEELMKERKAEKQKRKQERDVKRRTKEDAMMEREQKRKQRMKMKTDMILKKLISLEREDDEIINVKTEPVVEETTTPITQPEPLKGILMDIKKEMNENMITTDDINSKEAIKCVMFADGVKPGEGTSPVSSSADLQSPPLESNKRALLKEKKRKYSKHKKSRKSKKKIKVKVIREFDSKSNDSDSEDDFPPPSPPPGSPPQYIWPYPKNFNFRDFLQTSQSYQQQQPAMTAQNAQQFQYQYPHIPVQQSVPMVSMNGHPTNPTMYMASIQTIPMPSTLQQPQVNQFDKKSRKKQFQSQSGFGSQQMQFVAPSPYMLPMTQHFSMKPVTNIDFMATPQAPPSLPATDPSLSVRN